MWVCYRWDAKIKKNINTLKVRVFALIAGRKKAEQGKTLCLVCKMQNREYKKKYEPEKIRARDKSKREYRKANGLCVNCGVRPQQHKLICNKCYSTILRRKAKKYSYTEK